MTRPGVPPRSGRQRAQLIERVPCLLCIGRLAVPFVFPLEFLDALAGNRVGQDQRRLLEHGRGGADRAVDLAEIMPIDLDHVPVPGAPLVGQWLERHDVLREAIDLDVVAIDDAHEVVQPLLAAQHARLPCRTRFLFSVRHETVDPAFAILAIDTVGDRHPDRLRQSRTQWSRARFQSRQPFAMRMALQPRAELAQRLQFRDREISRIRHRGVEHRTDVTIGQHQPVAIRPGGVLRIVLEAMQVQIGEDVGHAERAGGVAAAGSEQHRND